MKKSRKSRNRKLKKTRLENREKSWRLYQSDLKRKSMKERIHRNLVKFGLILALAVSFTCVVIGLVNEAETHHMNDREKDQYRKTAGKNRLKNAHIKNLLDRQLFHNLTDEQFNVVFGDRLLKVEVSIDPFLQRLILSNVEPVTMKDFGFVAMEPDTGKILAMISHDKYEPDTNNCIDSRFPAASIFKIVTAAAAIEECNLNSDSDLSFCGGKYTLYKSQLKKRSRRRSIRVAFKDSFAQSINPVFGKIGQHYLGREVLLDYAKSFGFNRPIDLEIPVESSVIHISEKPYHWAEIACGFNSDTLISPLHAAMVASAVVNGGKLPKPHIIEEITDEKQTVLYKPTVESSRNVVDYKTSAELREMMENTIKKGTCRKFFRGYRKNDTLSRLDIGGKTGSLCGNTCNIRYDWFVGYAVEKGGSKKIAVAVFIAHEKYIGKRSSRIARTVLERYFENYFAQQGL